MTLVWQARSRGGPAASPVSGPPGVQSPPGFVALPLPGWRVPQQAGVRILTALPRLLWRWLGWWPCVEEGSVGGRPRGTGPAVWLPLSGSVGRPGPATQPRRGPSVGPGREASFCSALSPDVQTLASAPVGVARGLPQPRGACPSTPGAWSHGLDAGAALCDGLSHTCVPRPPTSGKCRLHAAGQ